MNPTHHFGTYMESVSEELFQELVLVEPSFNNQTMISDREISAQHLTSTEMGDINQFIFSEGYSFIPSFCSPRIACPIQVPQIDSAQRSRKIHKSISWNVTRTNEQKKVINTSSPSNILQFLNPTNSSIEKIVEREGRPTVGNKTSVVSHGLGRNDKIIYTEELKTTHARDHIMTERKRREKLRQGFIDLSDVIPGLKKMDNASVLSVAVEFIKELQEKLKCLEEKNIEQAVVIKKSGLFLAKHDSSSSDEKLFRGSSTKSIPEIEVKLAGRKVLVRIHCENNKGLLTKFLTYIEELSFTVTSVSSTPITGTGLHITITAQNDGELPIMVNDLAKKLFSAIN